MRAKAMICSNTNEINNAVKLGLREVPTPVLEPVPFVLHLQSIVWAYIHPDKNIRVLISGQEINIQFEQELWNKIDSFIGG